MNKRNWLIILVMIMANACMRNNNPPMTIESFQNTNIGISEENLTKAHGEPLNKYHHDNGVIVYEYVERFNMGAAEQRVVEVKRYYFYLRNGKVISKQMATRNASPLDNINELP